MSILLITVILISNVCIVEPYKWNEFKDSVSKFVNQICSFFRLSEINEIVKNIQHKVENKNVKIKELVLNKFVSDTVADLRNARTRKHVLRNITSKSTKESNRDNKNSSTAQFIRRHGYYAESHSVQTRDGFDLDIHRVSTTKKFANEKIAILHHGLMGSSEDWLLLGPGKALPYLLSDAGYDVWLTNTRRNSLNANLQHDPSLNDDTKFGEFSFHEMGFYDLPALIDYVKINSGNDTEINFIGHSMGGTALLVLLSTIPHYNFVLKSATLLAPLAFMYQIKGPLQILAEYYRDYGLDSLYFLGIKEFQLNTSFPAKFFKKYCKTTQKLCYDPLFFLTNEKNATLSKNVQEIILKRGSKNVSMKTLEHFLQLVNSGRFHYYDYGLPINKERYGIAVPPSYDLGRISVPIFMFGSQDDWLCTTSNLQTLSQTLPNVVVYRVVQSKHFSHTDFVWGVDAPELVFKPIIDILKSTIKNKE